MSPCTNKAPMARVSPSVCAAHQGFVQEAEVVLGGDVRQPRGHHHPEQRDDEVAVTPQDHVRLENTAEVVNCQHSEG